VGVTRHICSGDGGVDRFVSGRVAALQSSQVRLRVLLGTAGMVNTRATAALTPRSGSLPDLFLFVSRLV
jgi:hypothetical protein